MSLQMMAQTANALNEPSTDEILTSIREIIEEFTNSHLFEEVESVKPITDVTNASNSSVLVKDQKELVAPSISHIINSLGSNGTYATLKFEKTMMAEEKSTSKEERLSMDEAMNALARRIGLNVPENKSTTQGAEKATLAQAVEQKQPETVQVEEVKIEEVREKIVLPESEMKSQIQSIIADEKFFEQAENLVDGIVRPVLREWLDKNLSSMMERILRDEVKKSLKLDH